MILTFDENRLTSIVKKIRDGYEKSKKDLQYAVFSVKNKKKQITEKQLEMGKVKKLQQIQEESLERLALIAKVFEKHSLRKKIEEIITAIIRTLFCSNDISFAFKKRMMRNQQEVYLFKVEKADGKDFYIPIENTAGGFSDIVDTVIRVLILRTYPVEKRVLILDEPMKNLSKDLRPKFFSFFKSLCKKFQIQLIMSSHEVDMIEEIDNVFNFSHDGEKTEVHCGNS